MAEQFKEDQKNQGVTFIELLVSMVILALTLAGLLNVFASAKRWIALSQGTMGGGEIAKFILEPLQSQVREDKWGTNCVSEEIGCAPAHINIQSRDYAITYEVTKIAVPPTAATQNLRRVRIIIDWDEVPI